MDSLMRWLVARPVLTAVILFVVIVGVFSSMLVMGPLYGRS